MVRQYLQFTCPGCAERITVNAAMRDAMVLQGCPICGATPAHDDFSR